MELRGEWTATWRNNTTTGRSDGRGGFNNAGGGGDDDDVVVIDGGVFFDEDNGGVFFRELSTNARGAAEAASLCAASGLARVWDATSRSGKGAAVSAGLRRGAGYSERRVDEERRRERDPMGSAMHSSSSEQRGLY